MTAETSCTRIDFVELLTIFLYVNLKTGREIIKSNNKINIKYVYQINILFICAY